VASKTGRQSPRRPRTEADVIVIWLFIRHTFVRNKLKCLSVASFLG
jgi:hypothetical protein